MKRAPRRCYVPATLALCLLVAAMLFAQDSVALQNTPAPKCPEECPFSLSGVVVNSVTGDPVARAMVVAMGSVEAASMTDSKGTFHFNHLPGGNFSVVAGRPGFLGGPETVRTGGLARAKFITLGPETPSLTLRLVPQAVIHGIVTDETGIPQEEASVHIYKVTSVSGASRWLEVEQPSTDGLGRYRAANLAAGKYCVVVASRMLPGLGPPGRVSRDSWGYLPVSIPCAGTATVDSSFELTAGQERAVNVRVHMARFHTISGSVERCDAKQGGTPALFLVPSDSPENVAPLNVEGDGTFRSRPVAPGQYTLGGICRGNRMLSAEAPVTVSADVAGVHLKFEPVISIPISVQADEVPGDGGAVEGVQYTGSNGPPVVSIAMTRASAVSGAASGVASLAGGVVTPVVSGTYAVRIAPIGPWYIESATYGSTDLLSDDMVVTPGVDQPIYVVLRAGCGVLKSSLQGQVDSTTWVIAVPDGGKRAHYQYARAETGAEITMPCIPPGDYTVVAVQDGPDQQAGPEAVAPYVSRGVHVTVNTGQETSVTVPVVQEIQP